MPLNRSIAQNITLMLLCFLPALGAFVGPYLSGRGVLSYSIGDILLGFLSVTFLPLIIAGIISAVKTSKLPHRIGVFLAVYAAELILYCLTVPMIRSHTLGVAHRLTRSISPVEVQAVAKELVSKRLSGSLKTTSLESPEHGGYFHRITQTFVDKSELPERFQDVFEYVAFRNDDSLVFSVNNTDGYYWSEKKQLHGYSNYSVGNGLWVYYHGR